ncbi:MAG: glycosyltransferase family 9 protein, partial [Nitrospinales bacterium]
MFTSFIAKLLAFIFRQVRPPGRVAALPATVSRVTVVCTGGVGDVLLSTPAIRAIKESHPRCRLTAVVHHKRIDMLKFNPYVDELLPLKKSLFYYAKIHRRLKAEPPDVVFLFHANDPYIYCLASLACPGGLVGFQSPNPFSFLLGRVFEFDGALHAIENNLKLVALIGARTGDLSMNLFPGDGGGQAAERFFNKARYAVGFQLGSATNSTIRVTSTSSPSTSTTSVTISVTWTSTCSVT